MTSCSSSTSFVSLWPAGPQKWSLLTALGPPEVADQDAQNAIRGPWTDCWSHSTRWGSAIEHSSPQWPGMDLLTVSFSTSFQQRCPLAPHTRSLARQTNPDPGSSSHSLADRRRPCADEGPSGSAPLVSSSQRRPPDCHSWAPSRAKARTSAKGRAPRPHSQSVDQSLQGGGVSIFASASLMVGSCPARRVQTGVGGGLAA